MGDEGLSEGMRINRFLSEAGVASRRGADRIIEDGRVTIDGKVAVLGDKVFPENDVRFDGKPVVRETCDVILVFNKPPGITSTSDPGDDRNVIDYIGYHKRIYSIGRLDKDSEGLLLMTNNGDLADKIMRSRYEHEKEYIVTVSKDVTSEFIKGMANGVPILETVTKKCFVDAESSHHEHQTRQSERRQLQRYNKNGKGRSVSSIEIKMTPGITKGGFLSLSGVRCIP